MRTTCIWRRSAPPTGGFWCRRSIGHGLRAAVAPRLWPPSPALMQRPCFGRLPEMGFHSRHLTLTQTANPYALDAIDLNRKLTDYRYDVTQPFEAMVTTPSGN